MANAEDRYSMVDQMHNPDFALHKHQLRHILDVDDFTD
jgi:hypothetical protein